MKISTLSWILSLVITAMPFCEAAFGQSVLNPADPVVTYDSTHPPVQPNWGTIGKWVRTKRVSFNTDAYKCYIYKGSRFRLLFPKSYNPTAADGKKYPMMIFYHGNGEGSADIYDNEYQLYHGGDVFLNADNKGTFDGYVIALQTQGGWGPNEYGILKELIDYMAINNKLDIFHITGNGLSGGGGGTWGMFLANPTYNAAILPMSAVDVGFAGSSTVNECLYEPIWNAHGGLDGSPAPSTAAVVNNAMLAAGAHYFDRVYPTEGHDVWDSTWLEPDFWPFMNRAYSSNPWPLTGRTKFCPGDAINVTVGLVAGFTAYQWRKDGVVIAGATSNTIKATATGTYDARVQRGSTWSDWSHTPVVISIQAPTVTPPITVSGLMSPVIPAPDNAGVTLQVPAGYVSYVWQKVGSTTTIGTSNTLTVTAPGNYQVMVTEQYGCSSNFSAPFPVVDANGPNKPDPASNLLVSAVNNTSLRLDWSQNPNPVNNETHFEIYQASQSGGPYKLVAITGQDVAKDTVAGLKAGTKYFYIVRAVDGTGAAAVSNEASGSTIADVQPPTAPANVIVTGTTRSSVSLSWTASTDDVGVTGYVIYVNGQKSFVIPGTQLKYTVYSLQYKQSYAFTIRAMDQAGNLSAASAQVTAEAVADGLGYKAFVFSPAPADLPNFNAMSPVDVGNMPNISLSSAPQATNYAYLWEGYITIPTTGVYTFQTSSDDGSKVWLGPLNGQVSPYSFSGTAIVSNDGLHGVTTGSSTDLSLTAGVYPIAIAYYQGAGSATMALSWKTPASGGSFVAVPNAAFVEASVISGQPPSAPSNLAATALAYNRIGLTWKDNSTNETGFEVMRSTSGTTGFNIIATVGAGVSSYTDSTVSASTLYYYEVRAINQNGQSAYAETSTTTTSLPAVPGAPTGLSAAAVNTVTVKLNWTDNVSNESSFEVYRSNGNDQNYVRINSLPANTTSYADGGLFSNAVYYYKIRAVNAGGASAYTPEVSATTKDSVPQITDLGDLSVRYDTTTTIAVSATSVNSGVLTLTAYGLPSFANFADHGNGSGTLTFSPGSANQGSYTGLYVVVSDAFGGKDTTAFSLNVNDNYAPVIDTIASYTISENDTLSIPVNAHEHNAADVLTISATNVPGPLKLVALGNGRATLVVHPGYADAGVYPVVVRVDDANGLYATRTFTLQVKDKDPKPKVYMRFFFQDAVGVPWNSLTGTTTTGLTDNTGATTGMGLTISPSSWFAGLNAGPTTGNNSGIYPDAVLKDFYYFGGTGAPDSITATLTGLDTAQMYNLTFFSGSALNWQADNGTTTFGAGGQQVSLAVQNNTQHTVTISNLKALSNGTLPVVVGRAPGSNYGFWNAMVVTPQFDDGTVPVGPTTLTAQNVSGLVQLNWSSAAYNASGYEIWRAPVSSGVFGMIGTASGNDTRSYTDSTIAGNTGYAYTIRAVNKNGVSGYSDSVSITTMSLPPTIHSIGDIRVTKDQKQVIPVTTGNGGTRPLKLSIANVPPFVTLVDSGNGTGALLVNPTAGTSGIFADVALTVTDSLGLRATTLFTIIVTDSVVSSVYVNFSDGSSIPPRPWNTMVGPPSAGLTLANLVDDSNTPTSLSVKLVNGFNWTSPTGMRPRNGTTVYPESVTRNSFYEPSTTVRQIQVSGLSASRKYNFVFFASYQDGLSALTNYTINDSTVSLQASYNTNKTVQINGISPDVSGNVTISVAKGAGASNAYINAMVIESYDTASNPLLAPADLRVTTISKTTMSLQWQDRSASETGYEVWRSADGGAYVLDSSLPANVTSYVDKGLTPNTPYAYLVRAVRDSTFSGYSNVMMAASYAYQIYVNFTASSEAPLPWNNLNAPPQVGYAWSNFDDSAGSPTSVGMTVTKPFAGIQSLGNVTGNNSGIYPDLVLLDDYILFPGQVGGLKLQGLDLSQKYDLTFLPSTTTWGDNTTAYAVGNDTVLLSGSLNSSATVTMYGKTADNNGELSLDVLPYTTSSQAGLINAMVIQGYTPYPNVLYVPSRDTGVTQPVPPGSPTPPTPPGDSSQVTIMDSVVHAYPNPFHDQFMLSVPADNNDKLLVSIYDIRGRLVYGKEFDNLVHGINYLNVDRVSALTNGVYIVRIALKSGKKRATFSMIRQ